MKTAGTNDVSFTRNLKKCEIDSKLNLKFEFEKNENFWWCTLVDSSFVIVSSKCLLVFCNGNLVHSFNKYNNNTILLFPVFVSRPIFDFYNTFFFLSCFSRPFSFFSCYIHSRTNPFISFIFILLIKETSIHYISFLPFFHHGIHLQMFLRMRILMLEIGVIVYIHQEPR